MFQKAQRTQRPLKLGLMGPSGSGKTYSALVLATGLAEGRPIAVIDTENMSSSLYADRFSFDVASIEAPYTTTKYIEALRAAEKAGYGVVIIDSISHEWLGILEKKSAIDARGGNSFTNWSSVSREHESFIQTLVGSKMDLIVTMRSKADYVLTENDKGKMAPKKIGLAPVQREGMEFELDAVYDIAMDHSFQMSKDRTGLFDGKIEKISEATALALLKWRKGGAPIFHNDAPPAPETPPSETPITKEEIEKLGFTIPEAQTIAKALGFEKVQEAPTEQMRAELHRIATDKQNAKSRLEKAMGV